MAFKVYELVGVGPVHIYKRRDARSLRISITGPGAVRVTIPYWTPYATGLAFANAKRAWIQKHLVQNRPTLLKPRQAIGKAHHMLFQPDPATTKITTRKGTTTITVTHPTDLDWQDAAVQAKATTAAIRALRTEAEHLLPQRLASLAAQHDLHYKSVSVKHLKRRWGSCDQDTNIVLNLFLMQLPWSLIDYVLLHELNHTRHLNHSTAFWTDLQRLLPDVMTRRKAIRQHQPQLAFEA